MNFQTHHVHHAGGLDLGRQLAAEVVEMRHVPCGVLQLIVKQHHTAPIGPAEVFGCINAEVAFEHCTEVITVIRAGREQTGEGQRIDANGLDLQLLRQPAQVKACVVDD